MWTYSDGAGTVKGYWRPGGAAGAGNWVLVGQASGTVQGIVRAGEFSRRFRPVDVFADVPALPGYLGTVTAADGTALVDLVLDRNPFILANGPRRAAQQWCAQPGAAADVEDGIPGPQRERRDEQFMPLGGRRRCAGHSDRPGSGRPCGAGDAAGPCPSGGHAVRARDAVIAGPSRVAAKARGRTGRYAGGRAVR